MIWLDVLPAVSAVVTVAGISFKAGHEKRLSIVETKIAGSNQKNV